MPNEIVRIPTRDAGTEREGQRGDGIHPPVHNPSCPKGSMLIFLEATYHTTLPWTNKEHARRSLLYRYSPKYLHYGSEQYATSQPDWVAELSEEQQAVLEPPVSRVSIPVHVWLATRADTGVDRRRVEGGGQRSATLARSQSRWRSREKRTRARRTRRACGRILGWRTVPARTRKRTRPARTRTKPPAAGTRTAEWSPSSNL